MKLARAALLAVALGAASAATPSPVGEESGKAKLALTIEIDGAIGPATARHLKEALARATERRAEIVILRLKTPGGLVTSTREIIADVLASPVPIVGYVAPSGGHAASAGTYILYATHVAAMAPGTNLGAMRQLATNGLPVETLEPGWLIPLLSVITDPNIAVILMLIGVYGLIFEFSSPGAIAPGVIGTICLLLGLYALNMLPIDYAGLALMLLGIAFLIVEAFNPTVVLGLGGLAAFLLGAAMLFKVEAPGYQLSWTIIGIAAAMIFGLTMLVGSYLWGARKSPARVGAQAMCGLPAEIQDWSGDAGHVIAQGERWQAQGEEAFTPGETVEVTTVEGLTLVVRRRQVGPVRDGELP